MNISRRSFIRNAAFIGSGISLTSTLSSVTIINKTKTNLAVGVCTGIENSSYLSSAGYSYIEEGVRRFLVPEESESVFITKLEKAKRCGLPVVACNFFLPGELKCVGPNTVHEKIIKYAKTCFRRAKQAGVRIIVFGSGASRSIPEGFSKNETMNQFIDLCKNIAVLAGKYEVIIVLEPLNSKECNFINFVKEGGEIVKMKDHPNFLFLADLYHMKLEDETPENIIHFGKYIYHVHIAEKEGRSAPGTHEEEFTRYFNALKKIRYKGGISAECKWHNMELQAPIVIRSINKQ